MLSKQDPHRNKVTTKLKEQGSRANTLLSKPLNNAFMWNTAIFPGQYLGELLAAGIASCFLVEYELLLYSGWQIGSPEPFS